MKVTVLVVEDNPANMKLAKLLLDKAGYTVLQTGDAADAIAMAREHVPELILMDIQLPGMDGLTATTLLKQDPVTQNCKIIALTAFAMKGDEEKMIAAGCDGYIAKPFNYKDFLAAIDAALTVS